MSHKYLILGLLAEHPMTGYDIRKHVKAALSAATQTSYGTLYPTLHKLLREGVVSVEEIPQRGRPAKKVYHITTAGQREFQSWLKKPPASDSIKREFLLKLYLAPHLSDIEVVNLIHKRRHATEAALADLAQTSPHPAANNTGGVSLRRARWIHDYMVALHRAEIDWLTQIETQLVNVVPVTN